MLSRTSTVNVHSVNPHALSGDFSHLFFSTWKESDNIAVTISKPLCNSSINLKEMNPEAQCTGDSLIFKFNEKICKMFIQICKIVRFMF